MKNRIVLMMTRVARRYRVNRKYKDRVFRMAFQSKKDLLSLYNAVNGTDYQNQDEWGDIYRKKDADGRSENSKHAL